MSSRSVVGIEACDPDVDAFAWDTDRQVGGLRPNVPLDVSCCRFLGTLRIEKSRRCTHARIAWLGRPFRSHFLQESLHDETLHIRPSDHVPLTFAEFDQSSRLGVNRTAFANDHDVDE